LLQVYGALIYQPRGNEDISVEGRLDTNVVMQKHPRKDTRVLVIVRGAVPGTSIDIIDIVHVVALAHDIALLLSSNGDQSLCGSTLLDCLVQQFT
jgi:hypothetical protein